MSEQQPPESTPTVDWSALRDLVADDDARNWRRRRMFAVIAAVAAWVAAFVAVWVTWDEVASRSEVADQLPWLASSGLASVVLAIIGAACLVVAWMPPSGVNKPPDD